MDTNRLKRFAKEARIKLLQQIGLKLEYVLGHDSAELRGRESELKQLQAEINRVGKAQVINTVAYTWFNRLMALRFMDANGYNIPKAVTPATGMSMPEILQHAQAGSIDSDLKVDRDRIRELLTGRATSKDTHGEVYRILLVATCNYWHTAMPYIFEKISDYTELLLPDDLLSHYSIVTDIRDGMTDEDCLEEELIGWLYQFYISDKKDEVFEKLKKNVKITPENIPAATQLFTPHWIVRYMVENTLGKLWMTIRPDSKLRDHMPYYIESPEGNSPAPIPEDLLASGNSPLTSIRLLDPCLGSGHVLVYAFSLFYKIYEEEGYNSNEIPGLILANNLFGIDIDERAVQLASFALAMKARSYYNRYLRKPVQPHVIALENIKEEAIQEAIKLPLRVNGKRIERHKDLSLYLLTQADNFGSLIQIEPEEIAALKIIPGIWQNQQEKLIEQANYLSNKYHCVVTNPPYAGARNMNGTLKAWLETYYSEGSKDLFAAFIIRCRNLTIKNGLTGMITLHGWMFISTFTEMRNWLLSNCSFDSLIHIGGNSFPSMNSQVARAVTFILNINNDSIQTPCFDLDSIKNSHSVNKEELFLQKLTSREIIIKRFARFKEVQSFTFLYSVSDSLLGIFINNQTIGQIAKPRQGLATGDNGRFVRYWYETSFAKEFHYKNEPSKWYPYNKGGDFRKWYGNNQFIVNWENDGIEIKNNFDSLGNLRSRPQNSGFYFREGLTYSLIGNTSFCARKYYKGHLFDVGGSGLFADKNLEMLLLGLVNSAVGSYLLSKLNPTINFQVGDISNIPVVIPSSDVKSKIDSISTINIEISKEESGFWEENVEFLSLQNIDNSRNCKIEDLLYRISNYCVSRINELYGNEVLLNSIFSKLYTIESVDLAESLTINLYGLWKSESNFIPINNSKIDTEVLLNLISYSIGCIMGRFSLDKPGLILASQGEGIVDYSKQIRNPSFEPDEDNIIPFLEGEYFTDDVVGKFRTWLKVAFGEDNFEQNIKFVEESIEKDIRKYFVKDFYTDHIKRYKKRPIYWMFSSPKGHFKALIYMHRYKSDLCSVMLDKYLQPFINKLEANQKHQIQIGLREDISVRDKTRAIQEADRIELMLKDCREYAKTLYSIATQRIEIDLDDGVKVNYQKFKEVLVPIKGLEKDEE